jgi:WD40 repeat protein
MGRRDQQIGAPLSGHDNGLVSAAFSPTASASSPHRMTAQRLWTPRRVNWSASRPGHDDFVFSVMFSPDGKHVVTASRDKTARVGTL